MLAGVGAGGINAVIGSGSLITFPTLLAVGYSPVVANVSNNIGMVPGSVFGSYGFRRELAGQKHRARILASASALGGLTGAILLLALPSDVFDTIVPILVLLACGLMLAQPRLAAWVAGRRAEGARDVGRGPAGPRLPGRRLRRLLRRRPGRDPAGHPRRVRARRPHPVQRPQERAGRDGQRRRRRGVHPLRRRGLGGRRLRRRRGGRRRDAGGPGSVDGSRPRSCAAWSSSSACSWRSVCSSTRRRSSVADDAHLVDHLEPHADDRGVVVDLDALARPVLPMALSPVVD